MISLRAYILYTPIKEYLMITLLTLIRKYWRAITLFILTFITVLSLWPLEELSSVPGSDKTHHIIAYAMLMLPTAIRKPDYLPAIGLFFVGWSGAIELLQPLVNRYGELQDLAANIIGLVSGFGIVQIIKWIVPVNSELK